MSQNYPHPMSRALFNRPQGPMRSPARMLGWLGIGLGAANVLLPGLLARAAGMPTRPRLQRLNGLRGIGLGLGLLSARDSGPWLQGRVAGGAFDVMTVATGLVQGRPMRSLVSMAALGGLMVIDAKCAAAARKGQQRPVFDYSNRSGFPKPASEMRGAATR